MKRTFRGAIVLVCAAALALVPTTFACLASGGPPACIALSNCCMTGNVDDPSSCAETAQSGQLSDAQCGSMLSGYIANGECTEDAGFHSTDAPTQ